MKVSSFMVPAEKVVSCSFDDTLDTAVTKVLTQNVGSIIVLHPKAGPKTIPVGIVTKTDLLVAWQKGMDLKESLVREIMSTTIETVKDTDTSGTAAEHFERTKHRHAFVMNNENHYVGILSAYDIAVECARDNRAWPYTNRDELAEKFKVPPSPKKDKTKMSPKKIKAPVSPKCASELPASPHTFLDTAGAGEL